jgi:putative transposase
LLKRERVRRQTYATRAHTQSDVFNYIEMFCNPQRRHAATGNLSPAEFE